MVDTDALAEMHYAARDPEYDRTPECEDCGDEASFRYDGKKYCSECLLDELVAEGIIERI